MSTHVACETKPSPEFVASFLANLPDAPNQDWSVFYVPTIGALLAVPRFNDGEEVDERLLYENYDVVERMIQH